MAKRSGIDYVDSSWGPWYRGCSSRGAECDHCYARREMLRHGRDPDTLTISKKNFGLPARWTKHKRIFVCPWSDFFLAAADPYRPAAWDVIRESPQHVFIIPTKRPERILERLPYDWGEGWPNIWLVLSAGTASTLTRLIDPFFLVPAVVHGLSCEPLLEDMASMIADELRPIPGCVYGTKKKSLTRYCNHSNDERFCSHVDNSTHRCYTFPQAAQCPKIDHWAGLNWILTGCESGPKRRKTPPWFG